MLTRSRFCTTPRSRSRGLSLIEMLVGIVVGLFLVTGVLRFFADYLDDNRRLLLETRISQDLRTVADLIVRDLRRAGYWSAPNPGVTAPADSNPYAAITLTGNPATVIEFGYSRDAIQSPAASASAVNEMNNYERLGFKLEGEAIKTSFLKSTGVIEWLPLTDTKVMKVTSFEVTPDRRCVSLSNACPTQGLPSACPGDAGAVLTYPKLWVRRYDLKITAQAAADSKVVRRIVESVRVRNDEIENPKGCPP